MALTLTLAVVAGLFLRPAAPETVYVKTPCPEVKVSTVRPAAAKAGDVSRKVRTQRAAPSGRAVQSGRTQFEKATPHAGPGTTRTGTAAGNGPCSGVAIHCGGLGAASGGIKASTEGVSARPPSFYQRHPGWSLLGAAVLGGVIGYALHDDDERGARIYVGSPVTDDDTDDCAPHHPRGKHKGWRGHK